MHAFGKTLLQGIGTVYHSGLLVDECFSHIVGQYYVSSSGRSPSKKQSNDQREAPEQPDQRAHRKSEPGEQHCERPDDP